MAPEPNSSDPLDDPFTLTSVSKTEPPTGADGGNWCRYEIAQGKNTIVGYRQGSLNSVKQAVKEIVGVLNERRVGKRGRVHLTSAKKTQT